MKLRLSCKESSRLLSAGMDAPLGLGQRVTLRLHLAACDACTRVKAQMAFLRRAMAAYPPMPADSGSDPGAPRAERQ